MQALGVADQARRRKSSNSRDQKTDRWRRRGGANSAVLCEADGELYVEERNFIRAVKV